MPRTTQFSLALHEPPQDESCATFSRKYSGLLDGQISWGHFPTLYRLIALGGDTCDHDFLLDRTELVTILQGLWLFVMPVNRCESLFLPLPGAAGGSSSSDLAWGASASTSSTRGASDDLHVKNTKGGAKPHKSKAPGPTHVLQVSSQTHVKLDL
eukprot:1892398-Amphidinium_carterae.1